MKRARSESDLDALRKKHASRHKGLVPLVEQILDYTENPSYVKLKRDFDMVMTYVRNERNGNYFFCPYCMTLDVIDHTADFTGEYCVHCVECHKLMPFKRVCEFTAASYYGAWYFCIDGVKYDVRDIAQQGCNSVVLRYQCHRGLHRIADALCDDCATVIEIAPTECHQCPTVAPERQHVFRQCPTCFKANQAPVEYAQEGAL